MPDKLLGTFCGLPVIVSDDEQSVIELGQGKEAFVDDDDFEWLSMLEWHYHAGHAVTGENGVHMEKLILRSGVETKVMHRNDNTLDNRRKNLLLGSVSNKNQHKRKAKKPKSSKYKGVCWMKDRKRWMCSININGRMKYLGKFKDEEEAARAYDRAAREHYGEFARPNFPEAEVMVAYG
jgi:hypothetical protein